MNLRQKIVFYTNCSIAAIFFILAVAVLFYGFGLTKASGGNGAALLVFFASLLYELLPEYIARPFLFVVFLALGWNFMPNFSWSKAGDQPK